AGQLLKYKGNSRYAILFRRAASQECLTPEISMEIEDCRSLLRMASPARRIEAAKILTWMGPVARSAYGDVIEALKRETSADVRQELCKALIEMGPPEEGFIEQLEPLAKHSDPQVRQIVATILGTVSADRALETKVIDILLNLAVDNDPTVRATVIKSLAKLLTQNK
ncbi:MAG: HEAT repeat domain-containing protein, partial [Candidatus Bipolaricaulota bacterium]|nr:HEAT repeat domain-containing protein [Candidatus Bipolaricaulota bacterium]MDW8127112.1 HEAT repeat domain-containing protein [Candidatus Bipolaricaulota bacterium]